VILAALVTLWTAGGAGVGAWWVARSIERAVDGRREETWWALLRSEHLGRLDLLVLVEPDRVT
jgi:hypothetical protein